MEKCKFPYCEQKLNPRTDNFDSVSIEYGT